jgi:DNA-binding beta-propeller fold protein YncE
MTFRLPLTLALACTSLAAADMPHPALLALNKEGTLAIVNPATKQVVAKVRVGESPHEAAATPDGKLAFVSNYGGSTPGSTISVIDLVGQKEIHRVDLGSLRRPHGLAVFDGKLYFTCEVNKIIGRYDPETNQVDWLLGTGQDQTHMIELSGDGRQIYTANISGNTISLIDRTGAANWLVTSLAVGKGPEGFAVTPDGKELWAAGSRDGSVSIIDIAAKRVSRTFNVQTKRSNRLRFTPDGRLVLISDLDAGELLILERETRKDLKRIKLGSEPAGILIPPDGARAYVAVTGDSNIAVIDLKTFDLVERISTGQNPDGMAWVK